MNDRRILPYEAIQEAVNGDIDAIDAVLEFYKGYIFSLSTNNRCIEGEINHCRIDFEMSELLKARLTEKIFEFELE